MKRVKPEPVQPAPAASAAATAPAAIVVPAATDNEWTGLKKITDMMRTVVDQSVAVPLPTTAVTQTAVAQAAVTQASVAATQFKPIGAPLKTDAGDVSVVHPAAGRAVSVTAGVTAGVTARGTARGATGVTAAASQSVVRASVGPQPVRPAYGGGYPFPSSVPLPAPADTTKMVNYTLLPATTGPTYSMLLPPPPPPGMIPGEKPVFGAAFQKAGVQGAYDSPLLCAVPGLLGYALPPGIVQTPKGGLMGETVANPPAVTYVKRGDALSWRPVSEAPPRQTDSKMALEYKQDNRLQMAPRASPQVGDTPRCWVTHHVAG